MSEFPKKYELSYEDETSKLREKNKAFTPHPTKTKKGDDEIEKFVITLPPPNVTGILHIGHALMIAVQDTIVRHQRMLGKETLWIPGTDHAGIATQVVVEKKLKKEENKTRFDLGREKFLGKVWDWVAYSKSTIVKQTKKMGASCDWTREQFTLSEGLSRAVRKSFSNLYKSGKIYQAERITNWSIGVQSVISDSEIESREIEGKLYHIKYFLEGKNTTITVATTRPETIFADVAIAVNPADKRYKKLIGKKMIVPIINRAIPVVADEAVDMNFGTGALKITPTHDATDFEIAKRHNLPLDIFAIDKQGNFTHHAGPTFGGKSVDQFFDNVIEYLKAIDNLESIEPHTHMVPYCERSGTRIQPMLSKQWFVDVNEAAKKTLEAIDTGHTQVIPEKFKDMFHQWMDQIRPWCISRQLRRGHRIPVWYDENNTPHVLDEDRILEVLTTKKTKKSPHTILSLIIFNLIADSRLSNPFSVEQLLEVLFSPSLTAQTGRVCDAYLSLYSIKFKKNKELGEEIEQLQKLFDAEKKGANILITYAEELVDLIENSAFIESSKDDYSFNFETLVGSKKLHQDEDVFDTWFSSALRPFSTLGWPDQTSDFERYYPNTVLETGYDILFPWVARMMMMGYENIGQAPFAYTYFHGLVRDEKGQKISKSLGNNVDPLEIIEKYGTDALRLGLLLGSTPGNDVVYSDTKVDYYYRFINKLWNASRYLSMKIMTEIGKTTIDINLLRQDITKNLKKCNDFDIWMLYQINELIDDSDRQLKQFVLGEFGSNVVKTLWNYFCDWYIEISKIERSDYTDKVMIYSLGTLLQLLHPYAPFVTEKLWSLLGFEGLICQSKRPKVIEGPEQNYKITILMDVITEIRNLRNSNQCKPHEKVKVLIQSPKEFGEFAKKYETIIKTLTNGENIIYTQQDDPQEKEYITSLLINIKVGIKIVGAVIDKKVKLQELEKKLAEEQQFLQNMRNVLSAPGFAQRAPANVIAEKQAKMDQVKERISTLEFEIGKIKAGK